MTAVTAPVGSCLCAGGLCPHPCRSLEASSVGLRKTKETWGREGKRALLPNCQNCVCKPGFLCMSSFSASRLQPLSRWSPYQGEPPGGHLAGSDVASPVPAACSLCPGAAASTCLALPQTAQRGCGRADPRLQGCFLAGLQWQGHFFSPSQPL